MTREEAIEFGNMWLEMNEDCKDSNTYAFFHIVIEALKQEPRTGHWFIDERPESNRETICSNCEQPIFKFHKLDFDYRPHYCPNCGVKMK